MVTDLDSIARLAKVREPENDRLADFLAGHDGGAIDTLARELDTVVTARIDCTACGNCCRSLMINVTGEEADRVAARLELPRPEFDERYLEKGSGGMMIVNAIPCHFLSGSLCSIYEDRFAGCREFPALSLPGFTKRLFTIFMHYGRCPIVFNVVEAMKASLGFSTSDTCTPERS